MNAPEESVLAESSRNHDAPLRGRVAVITGGGTGLGLEIGTALVRRGAAVAIASRNPEHLESGRSILEPAVA